jgi:hypothetical protein
VEPVLTPGPGFDDLFRQLETAAMTAGKVWRLWPPLTVTAGALLLAALFGAYRLWEANQGMVLVTVRGLGITLAVLAATLVAPHVVRLVRFHQTFRDIGLRSALAAALAIGFKIHLLWFDPLFLRLGRVGRLLKRRQPAV